MGKTERKAYLEAIQSRYQEVDKRGQAEILDEFCTAIHVTSSPI